jgi:hypothetical protein
MSKQQIISIHNLVKKIFINKEEKNCDNYLSCNDCKSVDSIVYFEHFNNQILFLCNNCYKQNILQQVIEYYKSDLLYLCRMMNNIDENNNIEIYNKKNVYDHFMNIFQNCINIDYDLFCNEYYIDILVIFNKNKLLLDNFVAVL